MFPNTIRVMYTFFLCADFSFSICRTRNTARKLLLSAATQADVFLYVNERARARVCVEILKDLCGRRLYSFDHFSSSSLCITFLNPNWIVPTNDCPEARSYELIILIESVSVCVCVLDE